MAIWCRNLKHNLTCIYGGKEINTLGGYMRKTENVELTVLCLITDGDKVLLQNRVKNDRLVKTYVDIIR